MLRTMHVAGATYAWSVLLFAIAAVAATATMMKHHGDGDPVHAGSATSTTTSTTIASTSTSSCSAPDSLVLSVSHGPHHGQPCGLFVSPTGSDDNDGSLNSPFRTIAHAKKVVSQYNGHLTSDLHVYLRAGVHVLSEPLLFLPVDSGSNGFSVVYRNYEEDAEAPVLSGGLHLSGWKKVEPRPAGSPLWVVSVPPAALTPRQLYIDGTRMPRARTQLGILGDVTITPTGYLTNDTSLLSWKNVDSVEFVYTQSGASWTEPRCGLDTVSPLLHAASDVVVGTNITMKQPCYANAHSKPQDIDVPAYMENALEVLDEPGEWFHDRAQVWASAVIGWT